MEPTRLSPGAGADQPVATDGQVPGQSTIDLTDGSGAGVLGAPEGAVSTATLRELNEQKDAFLQMVAHDLQGPLLVIERFASILRDLDEELSADDRHIYAHRVVEASRRTQRQLTDLLDVDRLSRGLIEPVRAPTELFDLTTGCVVALGLEDRVIIEGGPLVAEIDAGLVERILENLLANAARHAGAAGRMTVHLARLDGGVLVTVNDDGPGVAPESREVVFDAFQTGGAPSSGSGVGLSVVRRLAELHGGRAWIDEAPQGGASLNVLLADPVE